MPTGEHESPIALAKLEPGVVTWLLTQVFGVKVPDYHHARARPTDVQTLVPRTYHADGMLLFCDAADRPVSAVVLEVQRGWDEDKRWTWKLYVAQLEAELMVHAALVVYCPDPALARWYRNWFEVEVEGEKLSLSLRPFIFTPQDVPLIVDEEVARVSPALVVLSALCRGGDSGVDAVFPALAVALRAVGANKAILYYDIVLAGLPRASAARWEEFMSVTVGNEYRSELFRKLVAEGKAKGKAEGKAEGESLAVLTVLEARGVPVPEAVREQILACTDLAQLDTWLRRAATAASADEVIRP
jgi:hypothetical protein